MKNHEQGTTLFTALLVVVGTVVVVQLWLVAAALDAYLREETGALWPATVASLVLFALNGGLLRYVMGFDARLRHRGPA